MTAAADDEPSTVRRPRRRFHEPQQRQRKLTVRLSLSEESEIKSAATERAQTAARFVAAAALAAARRSTSFDPDDRLDRSLDELAAARRQTARVGNNLNQIARELNSGGLPNPVDLVAALAAVRTTVTAIDTASAKLLKGH
ncbi:MobC family plasmid mobilization relaxosome protein [Kitasatospora sp. A2-31]|uniref:MobC family plasmid mobilization relaxosome protein n=1 Tax=Kitasatospora sp. A2-31 TaxID=2916414 RepID=UPI001EEB6692|nr:MobC family plasmid mobilization relaxosome protein [Kitasatospora sp. A2-31]MCG6496932.1 MobC family plasmid mobilization relaxosome protein [Kitasatospora sp. A2-31]